MTCALVEVSYSELRNLIQEASAANAFLPLKGDEEPFLHSMGRLEGLPDHHFLLFLMDQAEEIGFAVMLPHAEAGVLAIGPLYVGQQYQGQGLGRVLLEEVISWARIREVSGLFAQTWGANTRSRRLLEGAGFEFLQEVPGMRVNGDSTVQYLLDMGC